MAANGIAPFIKVLDANGDPIVGAVLKVYEVGTTTYRAIYSDAALTIPMTNPLSGSNASNAAGDFPRFYMQAGVYKLRAETSSSVLIWEFDNIDTGIASGAPLPVAAGGTGAITAAAARTNLGVPSNSELQDLASDIANLSSSVQNIIAFPQGRLTLTTGVPIISTGVTAGTAVYYTQCTGNVVPVFDGAQFNARAFAADLVLALSSNHVAGAIYDIFGSWDGATLQIGTGPAWNTATAGSGARGTGAGTTELSRVNGLLTNKFDVSARNGASTYTITANQGTYLGSIFMDGTNGQVTCNVALTQTPKWGVWNAYNRAPIILQQAETATSWAYGTNLVRPSNGNTANNLTIFSGLSEEFASITFRQLCQPGATTEGDNGIGYNSITAFATGSKKGGFVGALNTLGELQSQFNAPPSLGINRITPLENSPLGGGVTFFGSPGLGMLLTAQWRG